MASFTSYTPEVSGCSRPPRPTTALRPFKSMPSFFNSFRIVSLRYENWSEILSNLAISSTECLMFFLKTCSLSWKTATFVDVEPGLMINNLYMLLNFRFLHGRDAMNRVSTKPFYAIKAARAIEYNFVLEVSPRELSTQGTLAPMSMAPISLLSNFEQHL